MSRQQHDSSRRRFLRRSAAGLAAVPAAGFLASATAGKPKLEPSDPQAKALNYVHDASEASDHSAFKEGANCANCTQWQGGDKEWGACAIFPGKNVNANGWCTAWAKAG